MTGRLTPRLLIASLVAGVAVLAIGFYTVQRVTELPPANTDYTVSIRPGIQPATTPARVAALARHYLDEQTPQAEGHQAPIISRVAALRAQDATQVEAGIPEDQVAAQPTRIVWVVWASGDFLDLHDLPWSHAGVPYPGGRILIDDATQAILGVYPHAPGT